LCPDLARPGNSARCSLAVEAAAASCLGMGRELAGFVPTGRQSKALIFPLAALPGDNSVKLVFWVKGDRDPWI